VSKGYLYGPNISIIMVSKKKIIVIDISSRIKEPTAAATQPLVWPLEQVFSNMF
jgi:hypothetical protein